MKHVPFKNWKPSLPVYRVRTVLVVYVALPLITTLGLGWLVAVWQLEQLSEQRMQEEIELIARSIQLPLGYALEQGSLQRLQQSLQSAAGIGRVYGASVYNEQGDLVMAVGARPDKWQPRAAEIAVGGGEQGEYGRTAGQRTYSYFVPLSGIGGTVTGVLQVTRQRRDFDAYFSRLRRQALVALAVMAALLGLLLLAGHHWSVGRYMSRLVRDMRTVEVGEPDHRATVNGPYELRQLAKSLNAMLDSLRRTQDKLLEQRKIKGDLEKRLQSAEKLAALGGLAAGVAHELGTPLSVVDGHAQRMLRIAEVGQPVQVSAGKIREQVRRMEAIVRQLLDLGGGRRRQVRTARVSEVVRRVCAEYVEMADAAGVSLCYTDSSKDQPRVLDILGLSQAVGNLVQNAIQSTPGGRVEVRVECNDAFTQITVDDDGPGVPEEIERRIFEPFFTTKPVGAGTGLGLALVHRAVEDMGGRIATGRSPIGGAQFELTLPGRERESERNRLT